MARILIADDVHLMRMMLSNILIEEGHDVVALAKDGQEAIEEYQRTLPDLVMLDILMPRLNGLQALKSIHLIDPSIKAIMVTAIQSMDMAKFSFKCGAAGYVMKPFQGPILIQEVHKILQGYKNEAPLLLPDHTS